MFLLCRQCLAVTTVIPLLADNIKSNLQRLCQQSLFVWGDRRLRSMSPFLKDPTKWKHPQKLSELGGKEPFAPAFFEGVRHRYEPGPDAGCIGDDV